MDAQGQGQGSAEEDDDELFGVPDPLDGIVYFAKGSLPEHKNEKMDEVDRINLFDSELFADEIGTHSALFFVCLSVCLSVGLFLASL